MGFLNIIISLILIIVGMIFLIYYKKIDYLRTKVDTSLANFMNLKYRKKDTKVELYYLRLTIIVAGLIILGFGIFLLTK